MSSNKMRIFIADKWRRPMWPPTRRIFIFRHHLVFPTKAECTCQIFRKAASQRGEFLQLLKYVILLPWLHLTALYLVFSLFVLMEWETNFYYEKHKMTTDFVHCRLRIKWDCCDGGACKQTSEFHWKYCETSG